MTHRVEGGVELGRGPVIERKCLLYCVVGAEVGDRDAEEGQLPAPNFLLANAEQGAGSI